MPPQIENTGRTCSVSPIRASNEQRRTSRDESWERKGDRRVSSGWIGDCGLRVLIDAIIQITRMCMYVRSPIYRYRYEYGVQEVSLRSVGFICGEMGMESGRSDNYSRESRMIYTRRKRNQKFNGMKDNDEINHHHFHYPYPILALSSKICTLDDFPDADHVPPPKQNNGSQINKPPQKKSLFPKPKKNTPSQGYFVSSLFFFRSYFPQ